MNRIKLISIICLSLLTGFFSRSIAQKYEGFCPMLLKVEGNYDKIQADQSLELTFWWQNIGTATDGKSMDGFLETYFGHQRIIEGRARYQRYYFTPSPQTRFWQPGQIWKSVVTIKPGGWGGTYKLRVGLCDKEHVPIEIIGEDGKICKQVEAGEFDLGWGWGTPTIEKQRKAWVKEINQPDPNLNSKKTTEVHINSNNSPSFILAKERPAVLSIGEYSNSRELCNLEPAIFLREKSSDNLLSNGNNGIEVIYRFAEKNRTAINYQGTVIRDNKTLAEFVLCYSVWDKQLQIKLESVKEADGFELLEIKLPTILSQRGTDVNLLSFYDGGRLIPLEQAEPMIYEQPYDTRNAAAIITGNSQVVMESTCLDDRLIIGVQENTTQKIASLGMVLVNRVRAFGNLESIPVENDHKIVIEMLDDSWGKPDWQSIAKYLRKDLIGKNRDLYRRALIYKKGATSGPEPPARYLTPDAPFGITRLADVNTFSEIFDDVKKLYNILDGMPQVLYICGFQEGGFDNNYPYVLNTDQRAGTVEDLRQCIRNGEKYNAIIAMHDNYDDMALTEHYDSSIVCWDAEGKPWKGWMWAGGMSHIISPYKYVMSGLMQKRVKNTIDLYGIKKSYHLDVLTSEPLRYDFDPDCQASADKSLKGKLAIIDEFNKYGIDVTSETLIHPFVGQIGYAWNSRSSMGKHLFKGDKFIPLLDMVYHGTIEFNGNCNSIENTLIGLYRGNNSYPSGDSLSKEDIKWIYLHQIPVSFLYDKKMQEISEDNGVSIVKYDSKTLVKVDFKNELYEVVIDGRTIAKDWTTFAPGFKEDSYLAYSLTGGMFSYSAPEGWDEKSKLSAVTLTWDGEGVKLPCKIINGKFVMEIPANVPVRVSIKKN